MSNESGSEAANYAPITPQNALLIFVDLQVGSVATVGSMGQADLQANAVALAKAARLLQLPIIMAKAAIPGDAGQIIPALTDALPDAVVIPHTMNNVWETAEFANAVEEHNKQGRTHLVFAGVATDVGLCLPAIAATRAGYTVYALVDVSGTLNGRIEQAAWLRMVQAGVILNSWSGFVGEIQHDYTKEPGTALRQIIGERLAQQNGHGDGGSFAG